ncbi:Zinc knuckle family protein [Aphelenchoides avenae]|nr:Zinc knuckle family protein [Aphelenchus avenae]
MSNLAHPSARHQQYDNSHHPPQNSQHREQPMQHSAAGGRGSSSAPPVGPSADHAGDKDYEATSAFYLNASFHRAALDSIQPPLILTELPLEPFDGDIRRYPMFRNNFLGIVEGHPDLAPRHKLQYLLQFLRGEPYQLVNNFQLTDVNYFAAVNMLEERYGNEDRRRNLLLAEFVNRRPPSDELADLYRFHSEVVRLTGELKQLGDDVDAIPIYEQTLMGCLSEKLRFKLIQNYGCDREKSASAILNGLWRYASNREMAMTSGISWRPRAQSPPEDTCRERLRSPPPRSPSESRTDESTECSEDTSAEQPTTCVAKAVITRPTEELWRCQLCGLPHAANNCTSYATVTQRVRRIQKLSLCLHCLREGHRVDSCPQKGLDHCQICHNGSHHRAVCRTAAVGTKPRPLRRSSKCARHGSSANVLFRSGTYGKRVKHVPSR